MKSKPLLVGSIVLLVAALLSLRRPGESGTPQTATTVAQSVATAPAIEAPATAAATTGVIADQRDRVAWRRETLARLAYAQAWDDALPPEMAAFRSWTQRYTAQRATPTGADSMEEEGVALARARRPVMVELIKRDPAQALAVTVPAVVRQQLPARVLAELEVRRHGTGEFALQQMSTITGHRSRRTVFLGDATFTASPYGRRMEQDTKEGASLHGIVLDGHFALHESPLRVLEPGEIPSAALESQCPVSLQAVAGAAVEADGGVNRTTLEVVAAHGRIWEFCGGDDMLEKLEQRLLASEELAGPHVAALTDVTGAPTPPRAADAPTAWTIGAKRVLVIRVDFPDFPTEPISEAEFSETMNGPVKRFFEENSYGQTTLTATVSSKVYRMPATGASYATTNNTSGLHNAAREAATADYAVAGYDRVMVVFPNIGTSRVTGSQFTWAGLATLTGTSSWLNGNFTMRTTAHELGHNWGLKHSSLWRVSDGNPLSTAGASREYGDPFDVMGDNVERDNRYHFNNWCKNQLGWLPDTAVTTPTTSGTYRVHRFDSPDAPRTQPLALKVFRDGVRWYWIGYRQSITTNTSISSGANILWGFNASQESQLIDCVTPGNTPNDSALPIGQTLDDATAELKITPTARGGDDPSQWLDVQLTLPRTPPDVIASWGAAQNFLDVPTAITYVPLGLKNVTGLAMGSLHGVALRADGTVTAWGDNIFGQTTVPTFTERIVAVAAGGNNSGVLKADGTVQIWGAITNGQLSVPAGLNNVKQLAIGSTHAVALKNDGTVVGWGSNASGQISFPTNLDNVAAIAAGVQTTVILKTDGTVQAYGVSNIRALPSGLSGVVSIAAGGQHALAIKNDGTVAAWGVNANNQTNVPLGLDNVVEVAAGDFHSLALKSDGSIVAWGSPNNGKTTVPGGLPRARSVRGSSQASFALIGPSLYLTSYPVGATVTEGSAVGFSVTAESSGSVTYQWRKGGVAIPGATNATLTIARPILADAGAYDVVVNDGRQTRTTSPASLTVRPGISIEPASRVVNLSVLTNVAAGGDNFSMGYVLGGAGTIGEKALVIRAAGPSLGALGVSSTLDDPKMELHSNGVRTAENDNWGGSAAIANDMAAVGAFPFTGPTSRDAAFSLRTSARNNSVVVSAAGSSSGSVLAEIYDATPATTFNATTPRLINVSVMKHIGTGLTVGFVIGPPGGAPKRVLIRAIGPSLTTLFGLQGAISNPQLEIIAGGGVRMGGNDNWGGAQAVATAAGAVGAFPLAASSLDAAVVTSLDPGGYSVVVTGIAAGITGIALVEVYEVP